MGEIILHEIIDNIVVIDLVQILYINKDKKKKSISPNRNWGLGLWSINNSLCIILVMG